MKTLLSIIICYFILPFTPCLAENRPFTLVIDPGHGGKDPGAVGKTAKEKTINLQVALKLGNLIEKNLPDVKVVYTRKTDKFVGLDQRANLANKEKADLFISIHANALQNKSFQGTETFTLGLARTKENLEVAKRENAAILLEDDYQQKYEGFDPSSTESYIIFEFMQNKFMEQSISFASDIQKEFKNTGLRIDRGVKQSGFLVLRKTSMPSVLVELGFLTNASEEKFLASNAGQNKLAQSIYNAFQRYKKEHDRKTGGASATGAPAKPSAAATTAKAADNQVVYKLQILTSPTKLSPTNKNFKGYKNVSFYVEKGIYKYTCGESSDLQEIKKLRTTVVKDFKDAFIVTFKDGKRIK